MRCQSSAVALVVALALICGLTATPADARREDSSSPAATLSPSGYFEENRGQLDRAEIRYLFRRLGLAVGFAPGRVLFHGFAPPVEGGATDGRPDQSLYALELGDGTSMPRGESPTGGRSHFLLGEAQSSRIRGARHFDRVRYPDVYAGIDLVFFLDPAYELTYEFEVKPGGDPRQIELHFEGILGLEPDGPSTMRILTGVGSTTDGRLLCYQEVNGRRRVVASAFRQTGPTSYGVDLLAPFDGSLPLIVDPTLRFSTYWGAGGANNRTVAVDADGYIYMSGGTSSTAWPTTTGAFDTTHSGSSWPDVTVAKFDPEGRVVWSTLIGGPSEDYAYVSALNERGELYLAGRAGEGFPTTAGAFDRSFNGGRGGGPHAPTDAFVLRLSAAGDRLLYSTYIGGSADENGRAIHLLPTGELLVGGGNSSSPNLPVTPGAYKPRLGGAQDAWIAKVSADGTRLEFLTYFGPDNDRQPDETIRALGIDADGDIWIGGTTDGTDLTPTPDAFQRRRGGGRSEAYIAKLSPDGRRLVYFSWLGGSGFDEIETEGVSDSAGNFFVAGATASTDFPTSSGAFQRQLKGGGGAFDGDGWVARINEDGTLGFATLFGGSRRAPESLFGPVVDRSGRVYVTGRFASDDCPVTAGAFQPKKADEGNNSLDAFLAIFSPDGRSLLYGSYFGGSGTDMGRHLALHPDGSSVTVVTESDSQDFPLLRPPQPTPAGATVLRLDVGDLAPPLTASRFSSGFEARGFADWTSRFCPACNTVSGLLTHEQSIVPQEAGYLTHAPSGHRASLSGPPSADFDLFLWWWSGAEWIPVASAIDPAASEELTYEGGPGRYRWEVRSIEGTGRFELRTFYSATTLAPPNALQQSARARRTGEFGLVSDYENGAANVDFLVYALPARARRFFASFWVNPQRNLKVKGRNATVAAIREGGSSRVRVLLWPPQSPGQPARFAVKVRSGDGGWEAPILVPLPAERWSKVALAWRAAASAAEANGSMRVTVNGSARQEIRGISNHKHRVDGIRFGQLVKGHKDTSGTIFFDGFWSEWES